VNGREGVKERARVLRKREIFKTGEKGR